MISIVLTILAVIYGLGAIGFMWLCRESWYEHFFEMLKAALLWPIWLFMVVAMGGIK